MTYALVGNNDGPLRLLKSLKREGAVFPEFVGLQKKPESTLLSKYTQETKNLDFKAGFEEDGLIKFLSVHKIDILINCFCNFKFKRLLQLYSCFNVHPSYLPMYRGRHPMHWALILGEKEHGITIHKMTKDYDQGAIFWQAQLNLDKEMSVAQLREGLMCKLEEGFPEFIATLNQSETASTKSNTSDQGNYVPRRFPKDNLLTEWLDSDLIYRKIKALRSESNTAYLQTAEKEEIPVLDVSVIKNKDIKLKKEQAPKVQKVTDNSVLLQMPNGSLFRITTAQGLKEKLTKKSLIL